MAQKTFYVLTFTYGGIIENHICTESESLIRRKINGFAKENKFKFENKDAGVFDLVDDIKSNNGMSSHEIHLDVSYLR